MDSKYEDWRKASYSNGSGNCVEVASADGVLVRDSTQNGRANRIVLSISADVWQAFLGTLR